MRCNRERRVVADVNIGNLTGSTWTTGGLAVAGPAAGQQLDQLPSTTAYWFAWVSTTDGVPTRG